MKITSEIIMWFMIFVSVFTVLIYTYIHASKLVFGEIIRGLLITIWILMIFIFMLDSGCNRNKQRIYFEVHVSDQ